MKGLFVLMGNAVAGKTTIVTAIHDYLSLERQSNQLIKQSELITVGEPSPASIGSWSNAQNLLDLYFYFRGVIEVYKQHYTTGEITELNNLVTYLSRYNLISTLPSGKELRELYKTLLDPNDSYTDDEVEEARHLFKRYESAIPFGRVTDKYITLAGSEKAIIPTVVYDAIVKQFKDMFKDSSTGDSILLMRNLHRVPTILNSDILFVDSTKELLYSGGNLTTGGVSMSGLNQLSNYAALAEVHNATIICTLNPLQSKLADQLYDIINGTATGIFNLNSGSGYLRTSSSRLPVNNLHNYLGSILHDSGIFGMDVSEGNALNSATEFTIEINDPGNQSSLECKSDLMDDCQFRTKDVLATTTPDVTELRDNLVYKALNSSMVVD